MKPLHTIKGVSIYKGDTFGEWTVISDFATKIKNSWTVKCKCSCSDGTERFLAVSDLLKGRKLRCNSFSHKLGMYVNLDQTIHGLSGHPLYKMYSRMKTRCYNVNATQYKWYGGTGIIICDYWLEDFLHFYNWSLVNGWEEGLSIERIDSTKNYDPDNCEFIPKEENSRRGMNKQILDISGAWSNRSLEKRKVKCKNTRAKPCRLYKEEVSLYFDSILDAANWLAEELNRTVSSTKAQCTNCFRGKCKTIGGYKIEKV